MRYAEAQAKRPDRPAVCHAAVRAAVAMAAKRGEPLFLIRIPMLFLQGSRDALGERKLVKAQIRKLGAVATLNEVQDADHSFRVPVKSGRTDAEIL
jgi:predicted alpha/beta-hydrolase family hydrolase